MTIPIINLSKGSKYLHNHDPELNLRTMLEVEFLVFLDVLTC